MFCGLHSKWAKLFKSNTQLNLRITQICAILKYSPIEETSSLVKPWLATTGTTRLECVIFYSNIYFTAITCMSGYEDHCTTNAFLSLRSRQIPEPAILLLPSSRKPELFDTLCRVYTLVEVTRRDFWWDVKKTRYVQMYTFTSCVRATRQSLNILISFESGLIYQHISKSFETRQEQVKNVTDKTNVPFTLSFSSCAVSMSM